MPSLFDRARKKYVDDGLSSLAVSGTRFVGSRARDSVVSSLPGPVLYYLSRQQINRRMEREGGLSDILDTVIEIQPGYRQYRLRAAQIREEFKDLSKRVDECKPETIMEIGTAKGGTFYTWSRYVNSASTILSLDLPQGQFGGGYSKRHKDLFDSFAPGKESIFVRADSHQESTYDQVERALTAQDSNASADVDFLFIDGDHSYEGVKQDFEMYKQLVNDGGLIALHDIALHPDEEDVVERRQQEHPDAPQKLFRWSENWRQCNVDKFWNEIKTNYETEEIFTHPEQTWGGIGVIYL